MRRRRHKCPNSDDLVAMVPRACLVFIVLRLRLDLPGVSRRQGVVWSIAWGRRGRASRLGRSSSKIKADDDKQGEMSRSFKPQAPGENAEGDRAKKGFTSLPGSGGVVRPARYKSRKDHQALAELVVLAADWEWAPILPASPSLTCPCVR